MKRVASKPPRSRHRWIALTIAAGLLAPAAFAQEAAPQATAPTEEDELIEPAAREAVKRMVETLTEAERMSYAYDSEYDALQDDGEILEFGRRGAVTIRRPDRLRGESWSREGRHVRYFWDGANVSIFDEGANAFATTPRSGDLDSLTDFLREDIGFKMPLADLFGSDLGPMLIENVIAARLVDEQKIGDVECDHVALRLRQGVDVQLWIAKGEEALPQRMVINFATADGRPQFRTNFTEWDLSPRVPDRMFRFDAPKGAKVVPFVAPRRAAGEAQEGGQ
jgi:hypothetical protein